MTVEGAILQYAPQFSLDPALVAAFAQVETGAVPDKVRFEPKWSYLVDVVTYSKLLQITEATETTLQKCSWGAMQVMGSVAREHGFNGYLHKLSSPTLGVYYGCIHLDWMKRVHGYTGNDLISAYNAGQPKKDSSGEYLNKIYVDHVNNWRDHYSHNGIHLD